MSTALAAIQAELKKELAMIGSTIASTGGKTIRTKNKVFTLPDGRIFQNKIEVVILDHRNLNTYYANPYDPKNSTPPTCYAIGKLPEDLAPPDSVKSAVSKECHDCPKNQWGSALVGKGKACANRVRLVVAPPDAEEDDDIFFLAVPPASVKQYKSLLSGLESKGMLPTQVITEISFDPNEAHVSLKFKAITAHDDLEKFWAMRGRAQTIIEEGYEM